MGLKSTTVCLGYQQVSSLSASSSLTIPTGATMALIVPEGQNVRWRDDGTAPTASVGMPLAVGEAFNYDGDLTRIRFIEQVAGAKLNISYYA
jgi:hypothetical protein